MSSVLVVDDRATDRQLLATVLGHAGHTVREAASGETALELARVERPDLVISDILMKAMDGYEFVRQLREDPATRNVAVVFCTATYDEEEMRELAQACGVTLILVKPTEPEEILRVAGQALSSAVGVSEPVPAEEFYREHDRLLNTKLGQKVDQLETSERKKAEALTLLETLLSTAPVGFGFVDRDFRIRRLNETLAAVNGSPMEEQIGRTIAEVVPELWPQIEPVYRHVLDAGDPVVNEEVRREDEAEPEQSRAWLASYYPVSVDDEIIGVGVVVVDITERQQAEEFRSVVMENMLEGLCALDADGRVTFMNRAASEMLGWSDEELRGEALHPTIHFQHADGSPFPEEDCELVKVRTEKRATRVTNDAFTRKDGSMFPVSYSAAPLVSGERVRGVVTVFRDISEEQAEEARLQRELNAVTWVGRIREALDEGRMVLYSQPIIPLTGGQPAEELLIRMVGRDGELIPPGSFLPSAEKYGLITEIDHWVVKQGLALAVSGRRVEINLSAESIGTPDLLPTIERELAESGVDPPNVVFEITETALMKDIRSGETFAKRMEELGCPLALDDFGTGFGSFTYLKRLPIQYLKIDIEFVRELVANSANQHVVKAVISLARGFGQQTIAEGVEDAETLDLLTEYGVDFAQGYHLGRPAPLESS